MGLSGDLRDFDLAEVLQILVMGRKSGLLELSRDENGGAPGRVWLARGRVVHADSGEGLEGVPALVGMLHSARGRFRFESAEEDSPTPPVTIDSTLDKLLLEASMSEGQ